MRIGFPTAILPLLLMVAAVSGISGGTVERDAAFAQVPFEQWRSEGSQASIPWSVEVFPAELSSHQRMVTGIRIQVDGRKLTRHHVSDQLLNAQMLVLVQFENAAGTAWRTHGVLSRESGGKFSYTQNAFVLPGDYILSVAICDPAGLQHSFVQKKLPVPAIKSDPLQMLWDGLPGVEFIRNISDSPDGWFLPEIDSRLHLPVPTHRPVHVDLLLNTTPGQERTADPIGGQRRNMSFLIPALKVLSQMELRNGSMDVAFLDLSRRQEVGVLNWGDMKDFFARSNPGIIDVKALDGQWKMRNFFLQRLTDRIESSRHEDRIVIVLSGPAFFKDQEPAEPVALPQDPLPRVFYIRCRAVPQSMLQPRPRPRPGARPIPQQRAAFALPLDDLERPLDTPGARLYDVLSAEQFRRVLASVIAQISQL